MSDELIEGISPLSIATFRRHKFKRWSMHPRANILIRRKHIILSRVPIIRMFLLFNEDHFWGNLVIHPHFDIIGTDGGTIETVWCRSNHDLDVRIDAARQKLNAFLYSMKTQQE